MFPAHRIDKETYADGAIFATAPDLLAIRAAQRDLGVQLFRVHMLSVGTLTARFRLRPPRSAALGVLGWVQGQRLVRTVLAAQEKLATRAAAEMLEGRYRRIDAEVSEDEGARLGLDVANPSAQELIGRISARTIQTLEMSCPPFWGR